MWQPTFNIFYMVRLQNEGALAASQVLLKNSATVINDLKNLIIPQESLLFSTDVKSMYTNIDTNTGLNAIEKFISSNQTQSKPASNQLPNRTFLSNPETGYE